MVRAELESYLSVLEPFWQQVGRVCADALISSCSRQRLEQFERMLGIPINPNIPLERRREIAASRMSIAPSDFNRSGLEKALDAAGIRAVVQDRPGTGGIGMELLLQHGDHSRNGQGFLQEVDGAQQLVQRAMVRLTVPKGKFVLNPQLGSLLHTLGRTAPAQREQLALEYAQEALLEMPEVRVVAARCKQGTQADELLVKFELECTLADGQLARSVVEWRMNF